jgi:hypothetical protein
MRVSGIVVLLWLIVTGAHAADYYVSVMGSDGNPGTLSQPWLTIQKAADTMVAGDTVYIKTGTYNERVVARNSGTSGKYITYTAYADDTVVIDGTGITLPDDWGGLVDISGLSYLKVSGLQVKNAGPHDNNVGILVDESENIIIENNYTYNTASSGIGVWGCDNVVVDNNEVHLACNDGEQECITVAVTTNFKIRNNHVHHGGPGSIGGEGIDGKDGASNGKIYNNHVHHLNRLGIYIDAWDTHTNNIDVYNNIIHDCADADGIALASESGGLLEDIGVYNNLVYNNGENGISVNINGDSPTHPMKDITIINNTIYNNGRPEWGGGIAVDNRDVQNLIIRNNILSQNIVYQLIVEGVPMANLIIDHNIIHGFRGYEQEIRGDYYIEGKPLFVSVGAGDFRLLQGSPAIDSGSVNGAPATDADGKTRPVGGGYDIGAYEYGGSGGEIPVIALNPTQFTFNVAFGSTSPVTGILNISNSGGGTLEWTITENETWLTVSPFSGTGPAAVTVTVDPTGLEAGNYSTAITVAARDISIATATVTVALTVKSALQDNELPFGSFDTPIHGATVRSSIPVTGWALDDVGVSSVKIYRDPVAGEGNQPVYIGEAALVEGARPDVETAFPGYPDNSRAGWGYMLLTNFFPNGGNGSYTLRTVAADAAGNKVTLGSKTIYCDNRNALLPFGAIDTPEQGRTASGKAFINWGWVLTPMPNRIPNDGKTIKVWVDGVNLGHPVYNLYRSDIATLFTGYANSNGAVGYFYLDTTGYMNGSHIIQWTAVDSDGSTDGIGSRYFNIWNSGKRFTESRRINRNTPGKKMTLHRIQPNETTPAQVKKGFRENDCYIICYPDSNGTITIKIKQLERVEIHLNKEPGNRKEYSEIRATGQSSGDFYRFYQLVGKQIRNLPVGTAVDTDSGKFIWQPGPGFWGRYRLGCLKQNRQGRIKKMWRIDIIISNCFNELF